VSVFLGHSVDITLLDIAVLSSDWLYCVCCCIV